MKVAAVTKASGFDKSCWLSGLRKGVRDATLEHVCKLPEGGQVVRHLFGGIADDGARLMTWPLSYIDEDLGVTAFRVWYAWLPVEKHVVMLFADSYSPTEAQDIDATVEFLRQIKVELAAYC